MSDFTPKIEMWAIGKITPYAKNAKIHTDGQVAKLAKQITKSGWDVPIVVDKDGCIIKGHGRRLAALQLGMKRVPVIVRSDLSKADADAARLADNRVAVGDYDTEMIQAELSKLAEMDYDLDSMGFDEKELSFLTNDPLDGFDESAFDHEGNVEDPPDTDPLAQVKVGKALGFESIATSNVSTIKNFMAKIQFETGKNGEQAFVHWANSVLSDA